MNITMRIIFTIFIFTSLQGCAAFLVGGGASVALSAHDRRTIGTQIDDKTMVRKIKEQLKANEILKEHANINIHAYNRVVLLVGQVPNNDLKRQVQAAAQSIKHIRKLHNQVRIEPPIAVTTKTNDLWLASKVKSKLLADKRVDVLNVKVVVEDSEVFLMGIVKTDEADAIVDIVRHVKGVTKVVKAFELN
jgi:osmotically-inducible protein OsmY